jgi:hypothetical protein
MTRGATTLGQRRRAKVAELKALGSGEAALLGLGKVSERTLERMAAAWRDKGPGRVHRRAVGAGRGRASQRHRGGAGGDLRGPRRDPEPVQDQHEGQARPDRQYAAEHFGPQAQVPGFWTLREVWLEWFGPGGTRPRYDRSADGIEAAGVHVTVHRPGQVVALDTTPCR